MARYLRSRPRRRDESPNLAQVVLECARRPAMVGEIAAGGLEGPLLVQTLVAYPVVVLLGSWIAAALVTSPLEGLGFALVRLPAAIVSLLIQALCLLIVAQIVGRRLTYRDVLSALAFLSVLNRLVLVPCSAAGAVVALLWSPEAAVLLLGLVAFGVMGYLLVVFFMGLFDLGCLASCVLGFLAAWAAGALEDWLAALLSAALP